MGYMEIVNIIMIAVGVIAVIFPLQYAFLFVAGVFAKQKTYPPAEQKLRYGVIVCARNEERVIRQLVESIRKCDYPQDKLDIFVIAHNCTDGTAAAAQTGGAFVYEYSNPQERTKGYALRQIFRYIERDFGIRQYDGFHVFDADNVLDGAYFTKMNVAFLAHGKRLAVTSFRNAKNFGHSVLTALYGILYVAGCTLESGGRAALGYSARILGSGFLVSSEMVKDGWNIVNLSDDTDFTIEQVLEGQKVVYCGEAMYYDEHPTTFKTMWRQRLRWAKGTLIVCKKRLRSLFREAFCRKSKSRRESGGKQLRGSSFDLICTILPVGVIGLCIMALHLILLAFSPLFGCDYGEAMKQWAILTAVSSAVCYAGLLLSGILCYRKERRIRGVPRRIKAASVLLWPLFGFLLLPLQRQAMFLRRFEWKPVEHTDAAAHERFNR